MTVVTLPDQDVDNCIRLIHLNKRSWRPEDIPERLMREVFQNWDMEEDGAVEPGECESINPETRPPSR